MFPIGNIVVWRPAAMKLSIVVPAFNEERLLAASLASIRAAAQAFEGAWAWEIIVCDNNSTDRTAEIARATGAQVVFEPHNQISRARNTGARAATGDWLLFVDADSTPSRELFAELREAIDSGRVLGGGATIRVETPEWYARAAVGFWNAISRSLHWAAGAFVYSETAAFRRPAKAPGARAGQGVPHPEPPSAAHQRPQDAPLRRARTRAGVRPLPAAPAPHAAQRKGLQPLVRRQALGKQLLTTSRSLQC